MCDYDPRFEPWYEAGLESVNQTTFSNTYQNVWLSAVSKACDSDCATNFSGVWASEWKVSSVGGMLNHLRDGFEGSLAIVEVTGIVLASSSGAVLEPALSSSDAYLQQAASSVIGYDWKTVSGMLVPDMVITNGYNVVGTKQLTWDKFPVAAQQFVASWQ